GKAIWFLGCLPVALSCCRRHLSRHVHLMFYTPVFSSIFGYITFPKKRIGLHFIERPAKWRTINVDSFQYNPVVHCATREFRNISRWWRNPNDAPFTSLDIIEAQSSPPRYSFIAVVFDNDTLFNFSIKRPAKPPLAYQLTPISFCII